LEPQTQNVFYLSHRQPFLGQLAPSTSQWNEPAPAGVQRRFAKMKFCLEIHSVDVNKHSGPGRKVHSFQPGIDIHIIPESVFTSLRNRYSHAPEYAVLNRIRVNVPVHILFLRVYDYRMAAGFMKIPVRGVIVGV
jgi:hypothetical protein